MGSMIEGQPDSTFEDDEDRLIREGGATFAALSPEQQARITQMGDELLESMQAPGQIEAVDKVFRQDFSG